MLNRHGSLFVSDGLHEQPFILRHQFANHLGNPRIGCPSDDLSITIQDLVTDAAARLDRD